MTTPVEGSSTKGKTGGPTSTDDPRLLSLPTGQPAIASDTWIAPGATVVGAVTIGHRSSVWYGAVLRGDGDRIDVGDGTNIQDGCVLHADPGFPLRLGNGVSVGHRAVLHGCHIADDALIGMGAVILNGARIGTGCLIAAGAVVLERTDVPAHSLVAGTPAKIRRPLTDDEITALQETATGYQRKAHTHAHAHTIL